MRSLIASCCMFVILAGCQVPSPSAPPASPPAAVTASEASAPTEAAMPAPPPEWAVQMRKAAGCVGKTKAEVVATLGEPDYVATARAYRYEIKIAERSDQFSYTPTNIEYLQVLFTEDKTVRAVVRSFRPPSRLPAETVWREIGGKGATPATFIANTREAKRFWVDPDSFKNYPPRERRDFFLPEPDLHGFPFVLKGKLENGKTALLLVTAPSPPLKGEVTFNPNTDRREIGELAPDPGFNWKSCPVYGIEVVPDYTPDKREKEYPLPGR